MSARPQAAQRPDRDQVEYRIDEADVPAFLEAMAERQRIRRRDGARHWTLMRDLEDPRLWIESYQTPTWVEYVRHNQRRTKADAGVRRPPARAPPRRRPAAGAAPDRPPGALDGDEPAPKAPIDHP